MIHASFIFSCHFFHHDPDGAKTLIFDVPSCVGFLTHGEDFYAHDVTLMDFYDELLCGIYLSGGEVYCVYIYVRAYDGNGGVSHMGNNSQGTCNNPPNTDSRKPQSLNTRQDKVRNMRAL